MAKKIEFWEIDAPEGLYVYDLAYAQRQAKATGTACVTDGDIKTTFGKLATKRVIVLRDNDYGLRLRIKALMQKPDAEQGSKLAALELDGDQLAAIRAEAVIASWNYPGEPDQAGYLALDNSARDFLSERIAYYIAPDISRNPDFFATWNAKQTPPGA